MINKILIANRGEIALRIIRTCRELGIKTVAVYSLVDKNSLHVRFADEAVCIGPASPLSSYLNIPRIIAAAEITNADAIHPGYGFLSENAEFAEICNDTKFIFIGPTAEMINRMGNKSRAKEHVRNLGIPVIPGSDGIVKDFENAKELANQIGYPILLKAAAGGGGKGMRMVENEEELENSLVMAKIESLSAFGNDDVYIEKFIEHPRHIEVQILGDTKGRIIHLGERDCSIQRRHQKLIEETPSPFINQEVRDKMTEAAVIIGQSINYTGSGTLEFVVDKDRNFYFMEMNTRLQVEHTVTEAVTSTDLVKEQILIASGEGISITEPKFIGHSMECRINAEDFHKNFRPNAGLITAFNSPGGTGVRVDTHCYAGYIVPSNYDSLLGKLIVYAEDRNKAIKRMSRALEEFIVEGINTTIPLFQNIMEDPKFINNDYDTSFLDKRDENQIQI